MNKLTWIVYDMSDTDNFITVCKNEKETIEKAKNHFNGLTNNDLKGNRRVLAALANIDETGNFAQLENGNIDADLYKISYAS